MQVLAINPARVARTWLLWMVGVFISLVVAIGQPAMAQPIGGSFDHLTTGFPLQGAHQIVRCETCHINGIFKGTPRDCATCHVQNNPRGAIAKPVTHIPVTAACDSCHAATSPSFTGVKFSHVNVQPDSCQYCHDNFHTKGKPAGHIPTNLTCGACHNTTIFLPALKFDHSTIGSTGMQCASCHDNVRATGMPGNHLPNPAGLGCNVCHQASILNNYTSFAGGLFSHSGIASGCETCHGPNVSSSTFYGVTSIVVMPQSGAPGAGSHLPTSTKCETCHLGSLPSALIAPAAARQAPGTGFLMPAPTAAMIHTGMVGSCSSCHEAGNLWMGMNQYPITLSTPFKGFQTRPQATAGVFTVADAGHPTSGDCVQCHTVTDFSTFTAVPSNHIPTTAACSACHNLTDFRIKPTITAIHANSPQTNCAQCHGAAAASFANPSTNFSVKSTPVGHVAQGGLGCENCHVGAGGITSSLSLPVVDGALFSNSAFDHTGISGGCATCHSGQAFAGVTPKSAVGLTPGHIPMGPLSQSCETCHTNSIPSGQVPLAGAAGVSGMKTFAGGQFSHSGITSGCDACHGPNVSSGSFYGVNNVVVMPPSGAPGASSHMPTSTACESCHVAPSALQSVTTVPTVPGSGFRTLSQPTGAQIHAGVSTCQNCHEAGNVWMSVDSVYPYLPKVKTTGATYTGFHTRPNAAGGTNNVVDSGHPASGDCSNCHTATSFAFGLSKPANHIPTSAGASCGSCHTNPDFSVMPAISAIHLNGPATTNSNCAQCHGAAAAASLAIPSIGFAIVAPPSNHIPMGNLDCAACHVPSTPVPVQDNAKFSGAGFSHSGINSGCDVCHGPNVSGGTFAGVTSIVVMPQSSGPGWGSHIPSSTKCENCHLGSMPSSVVPGVATASVPGSAFRTVISTAAIHTGIASNCNSCHDTNYIWMGMDLYPIPTTVMSAGSKYTGFQTRPQTVPGTFGFNVVDPTPHPTSGDCSNCHTVADFSSITSKPANHIPTSATAGCNACHKAAAPGGGTDFTAIPSLTDIHANAPSTSANCAQCHSASNASTYSIPSVGFNIVAPTSNHIPMGTLGCESCHTGANTSITALPVTNGKLFSGSGFSHSGITSGCDACHVAGKSFQGSPSIVVLPPTSGGITSHVPLTSTACENCHLGSMPSTVVAGSVSKTAPGTLFKTPAPTGSMIHAGVTSCNACHESPNVWMGVDSSIYPRTAVIPATSVIGFQTRPNNGGIGTYSLNDANHPGTAAGDCSICHSTTDFTYGVSKPANHIPTAATATCKSCHTATTSGGAIDFTMVGGAYPSTTSPSITNIHLYAPSTTGNCAQCHSAANATTYSMPSTGFVIKAADGTHMPMGSLGCESCHTGANTSIAALPVTNGKLFSGSGFSHSGITSGCDACHVSGKSFQGAPGIVVMPPTSGGTSSHVPTSTTCENCHLGSMPSTVVAGSVSKTAPGTLFKTPIPTSAMIHAGQVSCNSCHEGSNTWMGVDNSVYPRTSSWSSGSTTPVIGFQTRPGSPSLGTYSLVDGGHPDVTKGDCANCHAPTDWSSGVTKPSNHIPTGASSTCTSCHKSSGGPIDYSVMPALIDIHTYAPSTSSNCAQCHSAANAAAYKTPHLTIIAPSTTSPLHIPMGSLGCESCHTSATTGIGAYPVPNGAKFSGGLFSHSGVTSGCEACHAAGLAAFQGTLGIVVLPSTTSGASSHIPYGSSLKCENCHLGSVPSAAVSAVASKLTAPGTLFRTSPPTGAMIHVGVGKGCVSCHGDGFQWASMDLYPRSTALGQAPYKGFQTRPLSPANGLFSLTDSGHNSYTGECSDCHTTTDYTTTNKPTNHIPTLASATCANCHLNGDFTISPTVTNIHLYAPSKTANCVQCHASAVAGTFAARAGYVIKAPDTTHIAMASLSCESCHLLNTSTGIGGTTVTNSSKFTGSWFSHTGINSGCSSCHGYQATAAAGLWTSTFQGSPKIIVMPSNGGTGKSTEHIPTTAACEACHLGSMPASAVAGSGTALGASTGFRNAKPLTAQTHNGITGSCNSCHEAGMAWVSSDLYPITPNTVTGTVGQLYTGFQTRPTAAGSTYSLVNKNHQTDATDCSVCHTSTTAFTAAAKPNGHMVTTSTSCATCHTKPSDWSVNGGLASNQILHTTGVTATGKCISCHTAGTGAGPFAGCTAQDATCTAPPPITYQPKMMPLAAGGSATAPSASTHIPAAGISCDGCHTSAAAITTFTSFGSTPMNHAVIGAMTCKTCHENAYVWYGFANAQTTVPTTKTPLPANTIVVRPKGHNGTQDCKGCHNTTKFKLALIRPVLREAVNPLTGRPMPSLQAPSSRGSLGTVFDHQDIEPGKCKTCHDGQHASGMPAKHLMVSNSCDVCHRTSGWKPAYFNHGGVSPNTCMACHNGMGAPAKPPGHFMTARSCDNCHKTTTWLPVTYSHVSPSYQPTAGMNTCVSCHVTNGEIIPRQMRTSTRGKPILVGP